VPANEGVASGGRFAKVTCGVQRLHDFPGLLKLVRLPFPAEIVYPFPIALRERCRSEPGTAVGEKALR
jgi:hypothetical protein